MMQIPLVDLQIQTSNLRPQLDAAVARVIGRCDFILGEEVRQFEAAFAKFCDCQYGVGVSSGTDALHLALRAAGVGPGDEVILPANTFFATAAAVVMSGAKPVCVDPRESDFLVAPEMLRSARTSRTKVVIPVHLYGQMLDESSLRSLCEDSSWAVIEDCAQAHGARSGGKASGSWGLMGCFSFFPGKNLGAFGDGGMITTQRPDICQKLQALRNYGSPVRYEHPVLGFNNRLDTLQAAVLSVKLPHLQRFNEQRHQVACRYEAELRDVGDLILPKIPQDGRHVLHLYAIRTRRRGTLLHYLKEHGIAAGIHYPTPIHLHGAFSDQGWKKGQFPVAERLAAEVLSLPIYPELTDDQTGYVAETVRRFFDHASR